MEQPAAGDPLEGEDNGHVEGSSTEYQELALAINTLHIDQVVGAGAPTISTTTISNTPTTTTPTMVLSGSAASYPGIYSTYAMGNSQTMPGGFTRDIPAGLGVLKPVWSLPQYQVTSLHQAIPAAVPVTSHMHIHQQAQAAPLSTAPHMHIHQPAPVVPPCNPTVNGPLGWPGWGGLQSTPGQVGVPLVPPTLLPQSLLHQDWFNDGKSSEGKNKRSKHWMRPDFYIPTEKRYNELS